MPTDQTSPEDDFETDQPTRPKKKSARPKFVPTPDQILRATRDVRYELDMLEFAANSIGRVPEGLLRNVLLESFLLHLRNLDDFFSGTDHLRGDKDDVIASDMAPGWVPRELISLPEDPPDGVKRRDAMNKHLQHLTYTRTLRKPMFRVGQLLETAQSLYQEFLSCVQDGRVRNALRGVGPAGPDLAQRIMDLHDQA